MIYETHVSPILYYPKPTQGYSSQIPNSEIHQKGRVNAGPIVDRPRSNPRPPRNHRHPSL
jgi:hypothetical protein